VAVALDVWRIMNRVRSAAAIPFSSVLGLNRRVSVEVSEQPARFWPALPPPWGSASLMTTTIFFVPARHPIAPPTAGV